MGEENVSRLEIPADILKEFMNSNLFLLINLKIQKIQLL